jgi:hypothetical protein
MGTQHVFGGEVAYGIAVWSSFLHAKPSQLPENLLSGESLLDCSAYVDLNPIRAAIAGTIETSDSMSVKKRENC